MKPYLIQAVADTLFEIFVNKRYADKAIAFTLKADPNRGARDRAFIAEHTYEIVRYYRLYAELLGYKPKRPVDWWKIFFIHATVNKLQVPNYREFEGVDADSIPERTAELRKDRRNRESILNWMDELGAELLGEKWEDTIHALNQPAPLFIRANTLVNSPVELIKALYKEGLEAKRMENTDALLIPERVNLFRYDSFKEGRFEVQDYSSQLVAPFLQVEPGMRVVDACAGGGGKSLHLAALMKNQGKIISLDTEADKLVRLRERATRAKTNIIETRAIEGAKTIKRLYDSADRLLLDVPCTGMGVLRRNPDAKWKLTPEFYQEVLETQYQILSRYSPIIKPGGYLVYATCSVLPTENRNQVDRFLNEYSGFEFIEDRSILPQDDGYDGFYMALIKRN